MRYMYRGDLGGVMRVLSLVLAGVLLFSSSIFAVDAPFIVASLPNLDLPQNRVRTEDDSGTMISVSLSGTTNVASDLADNAITWSWEEELEPLDILEYVEGLPYDEWVEIDEVTCRRLFEDLIQISLTQMDLEEGGHFEDMLREIFFYFTPEREYYFPPYEEDFSEREALFPVKIMRDTQTFTDYDTLEGVIKVELGRFSDDLREFTLVFDSTGLSSIELNRKLYYPGEMGPKKTKELSVIFYLSKGYVTERWFNDDDPLDDVPFDFNDSLFIDSRKLFEYELGNSIPVVNNTEGELSSDLKGIGHLFDLPYSWHAYGQALFQSYSSLIELCKLQLNILDQLQELESLLWRELFYYEDGVNYFGVEAEFASVKRIRDLDSSKEEFLFDVGNAYTARYINLVLFEDFGDLEAGYEWGIESAVLTRNIILSNGEIGKEKKVFTFKDGLEGFEMEYWVLRYDSNEDEIYRQQLAYFIENNHQNLVLVSN